MALCDRPQFIVHYKSKPVDVKRVARVLGVRYVLDGSVRKAGNRVRITGQLIDTATGAHIWADRFDGALDDIFELQDQVASNVTGAIEPKLRSAEIERAVRKPTDSLDAWDLYLRAVAESRRPNLEGAATAISLAHQVLAIDPSYAPAASMIGWIRHAQSIAGMPLTKDEIAEALHLARRAVDLCADDSETLWQAAISVAMFGGEREAALRATERALALNPNSAAAWFGSAGIHCWLNQPDAAIEAIQRAIRLSPRDPLLWGFAWVFGYALMLAGRYDEALGWVDRSLHDRQGFHAAIRGRVALLGYLGRNEEAREWIDRLLAVNPVQTVTWFKAFGGKYLSSGTMAVWVEGLRKAGYRRSDAPLALSVKSRGRKQYPSCPNPGP